ncbi:hypothetical protein BC941DRAFT_473072 [Chlamydoabsidia padenii]|nr:hypothetical protein BC941DRAFT_473072 [Chlamydoabsidia padenii]
MHYKFTGRYHLVRRQSTTVSTDNGEFPLKLSKLRQCGKDGIAFARIDFITSSTRQTVIRYGPWLPTLPDCRHDNNNNNNNNNNRINKQDYFIATITGPHTSELLLSGIKPNVINNNKSIVKSLLVIHYLTSLQSLRLVQVLLSQPSLVIRYYGKDKAKRYELGKDPPFNSISACPFLTTKSPHAMDQLKQLGQ